MTKDFILSKIKRTAAQNGGIALGRNRFEKATGIAQTDWYGKYWSRWSDPVGIEACWHKRFERSRTNGEWFVLSLQEVKAFKRRSFM